MLECYTVKINGDIIIFCEKYLKNRVRKLKILSIVNVSKNFYRRYENYAVETILIDDYSEITEILSAIQKRYLRRTVFISGAAVEYTNYSEKEVKEFVKNSAQD